MVFLEQRYVPQFDEFISPLLEALLDPRHSWKLDGACADAPHNLFFPVRGTPESKIREAQEYCERCPVKQQCFDYAWENRDEIGIWGGTTGRDRRKMRYGTRAKSSNGQPAGRNVLQAVE